MSKHILRIALLLAMSSLGFGAAFANDVVVPFPTAGDAYCSATNGCGTIPSGGQTAFMWTAGDYVISDVFTSTGLSSVTDLTANWTFQDFLGGGNTETWYVYINGITVAQAVLPDDNFMGDYLTVSGTVDFSAIAPVDGGYQVELVLQNTVPGGGGSVAWTDGGTTTLSGTGSTPEPNSLILMGTALCGLAMSIRRRLL
jgi:PEP-CTERM motif